jgi:hypothetical protein
VCLFIGKVVVSIFVFWSETCIWYHPLVLMQQPRSFGTFPVQKKKTLKLSSVTGNEGTWLQFAPPRYTCSKYMMGLKEGYSIGTLICMHQKCSRTYVPLFPAIVRQ